MAIRPVGGMLFDRGWYAVGMLLSCCYYMVYMLLHRSLVERRSNERRRMNEGWSKEGYSLHLIPMLLLCLCTGL